MLRNIYIFSTDGILLFNKAWDDIGQDPLLISGFCSALWMFAKQIGGIGFRLLETEVYTIIGTSSKEYQVKIIIIIDNTDDIKKYKDFIETIKEDFCHQYKNDLIKIKKKESPVKLNLFRDYNHNLNLLTMNLFSDLVSQVIM
ncbi:MAG: hypothetical protein ACTSPY_07580 [Candidatus Helarchaeota archaeon]